METKLPYTIQQIEFVNYVSDKVRKLFFDYTEPAHGIDHTERVVKWAVEIAVGENAKSIFLCELSAWLHDIGRTIEDNPGETSRKHHELSYILLKQWFKEDERFNFLITDEKLELLYAVRYHWNDVADKYDNAWILRDADKLDLFGQSGLDRAWSLMDDNPKAWDQHLRNVYSCYHFVKTNIAKQIIKDNHLLEENDEFYKKYLKEKIEVIKL